MMRTLLVFAITFMTTVMAIAGGNDAILGKWYTTDNKGIVEIYECNGDELCGKIIWLDEPNEEDGTPKTNINHPDESRHDEPIIGLQILNGFEKDGTNEWEDGEIYDPENGKTYSCKMTLEGNKLKVRGYIGISLLGRTEVWTRVKE